MIRQRSTFASQVAISQPQVVVQSTRFFACRHAFITSPQLLTVVARMVHGFETFRRLINEFPQFAPISGYFSPSTSHFWVFQTTQARVPCRLATRVSNAYVVACELASLGAGLRFPKQRVRRGQTYGYDLVSPSYILREMYGYA